MHTYYSSGKKHSTTQVAVTYKSPWDSFTETYVGDELVEDSNRIEQTTIYLSGKHETWHENGQLKEERYYEDDQPIGTWKSYYENGQLKQSVTYNELHHEDGAFQTYHANGRIACIGRYGNGFQLGEWSIYNEEEVLVERKQYVTGILKGPYKTYHPNGQLKTEGQYASKRESGGGYIDADRDLYATVIVRSVKTGTWTTYDKKGKVIKTETYE